MSISNARPRPCWPGSRPRERGSRPRGRGSGRKRIAAGRCSLPMARSPGSAEPVTSPAGSPGPVLTMAGAPLAFHVMAKPTGAICNLDCEYCFFLSKEMLYPGSRFRMAADLQETYLRQLLEAHARAPEVIVAWQGGEPTMKDHDFLVGISIDGPRQMHDAYRVDKGGKPTFDRVMRGLDVLKRHGVDWNVLTTIHAVNGDHGREVYTFLRDELGATFIQYIPIIERATEQTLPI